MGILIMSISLRSTFLLFFNPAVLCVVHLANDMSTKFEKKNFIT